MTTNEAPKPRKPRVRRCACGSTDLYAYFDETSQRVIRGCNECGAEE